MSGAAIEGVFYEKGWGVYFDVRHEGQLHRFSISKETLGTLGLSHRTKPAFPDVFDANAAILLKVADVLVRTNRLERRIGAGATEILPAHIAEIMRQST
ncbi:MAG TPA: hypothetical protein VEY50_12545 [Lysobacter sp.]|nr:hypothetical protein [Lysobacter sp.]